MKQIETLVNSYWDAVQEHWHWLHAHPELSGQEEQTAAYIADALRKMGLTPTERVGGYGVTALIEGAKPGKCVGLRADFDALPLSECTGLPFASQNPGAMHACGHDAHTAMLLGAARILCDLRDQFSGTVKLIFQPSEENSADSGAKKMIADGVLQDPKVDAIIGQHVEPVHSSGQIALKKGSLTAASDRFFITVKGKSCHASSPHKGVDAVTIGAQIITALQNIISRTVSPFDNSVITIGKVTAGTRYNVVAESCEMEGTCRNLNPEVRGEIPQRMENIIKGIAEGMGAEYEFTYIRGYSPLVNDGAMAELVATTGTELLGEDNVIWLEHAGMGGEDFSFYAEQIPGIFYRLGCGKEGTPHYPLHNPNFIPDAPALKVGTTVMVASALRFLNGER